MDKLPPKIIEVDGIRIRLVYSMPPAWIQTEKFVQTQFKSTKDTISDLGPIEWFLNLEFSFWGLLIANVYKLRGLTNKILLPTNVQQYFPQCNGPPKDLLLL